jgi:hypothetical protein
VCVCVCVSVTVDVREREREQEKGDRERHIEGYALYYKTKLQKGQKKFKNKLKDNFNIN